MTDVFAKFLPVPREQRGRIIILALEGNGIDRLRDMTKEHERERYKVRFEYGNHRSLSQNDRFHAMARALAESSGYTLDEAKAILKHEGGIIIPYDSGFTPPTREGVFVELYGEIEFQVSTSKFTKPEMSKLMENSERYLANAGVQWYD